MLSLFDELVYFTRVFPHENLTLETPLVEVTRLDAPARKAAIFQYSVPASALKPGYYTCQITVVDDVAGTFAFPRLPLLVRQ